MTDRAAPTDGLSREVFALGETITLKLNERRPEVDALPFYKLLPTTRRDLLRVRLYVRRRCIRDVAFRNDIVSMCRADILFWAAMFANIYEPRTTSAMPLVLWSDQANLLAILRKWFGRRSMGVGKSRGIGDSWVLSLLNAYALLFIPDAKIGVISKDEDSADSDDENSLLGKLAFILDKLPYWMTRDGIGRPLIKRNKSTHLFSHTNANTTVQAFPATDNKVRGMRFTVLEHDENAFWPGDADAAAATSVHTTNCRIYVSTFCGTNNHHYNIMYAEKSSLLRIFHWWWANPARYEGAYTTEHGRVKILDESYKFPPDYPFVTDGLLRSAYVDAVLRESGSTRQSVLEELYGVTGETSRRLFRSDTVNVTNMTIRPPLRTGYVARDKDGSRVFRDRAGEKLHVWNENTGGTGGPYAVACDLAAGRMSAYSVCAALDLTTGEQVVEYADNTIDIVSFASVVYDILLWLGGKRGHGHAYLTFENNGELGNAFGAEMLRLGYGNIAHKPYKIKPANGAEEYYGMRNKDGGLKIFIELDRAVLDADVIVRSEGVSKEMGLWDKEEKNGKIKPLYPYREDGHGDRSMSLAMAWFLGRERRMQHSVTPVLNAATLDRRELYSELYETPKRSGASWGAGWKRTS